MAEEKLSKGQKAYLTRLVNEFKANAEEKINEIQELKEKLIEGKAGEDSLLQRFSDAEQEIAEKRDQVKKLHKDIFVAKIAGQKSLSQSIEGFTEEFKKEKKAINEIKVEIEDFQNEVFGYENAKGVEFPGIKSKIEGQVQDFKKLYDQNSDKQKKLLDEIEKLLKGASTVALAKAFKEHKDSFKGVNMWWMILFVAAIASIMIMSVYIFSVANYEVHDMWKGTLGNLPFIGGAIWLAVYASKQRSQNKRLQEEYAFKEDVAKIYYGLKKEVEELDDSTLGKELKDRIIHILVDAVSLNPSDTLESSTHNDRGPILESLEKIKSILTTSRA